MIRFHIFEPYPQLFYAFSQRQDGGMASSTKGFIKNRKNFFNRVNIPEQQVVMAGQIHSHNIAEVVEGTGGRSLKNVDGLITAKKNIFLVGKSADCIIAFFYAPKSGIVAVAHTGWRGVLAEIAVKMVDEFKKRGEMASDILVAIGPSVRVCHYQVKDDVAHLFVEKFGNDVIYERDGNTCVDLPKVFVGQLVNAGVVNSNIEDCRVCTYESADYFSARRDRDNFKSFLGMVGLKS